jgi:hypothetical protein
MVFQAGDAVRLVFGSEEMIVTKVEPRKVSAVARSGAVFEEHPRNFILVRREKPSE